VRGDVLFPPLAESDWMTVESQSFSANDRDDHDSTFEILRRNQGHS
jgi:hypothetical protein